MPFDAILAQIIDLLKRQGRVSYSALKRRFDLDDDYLNDLKDELLYVNPVRDDEGRDRSREAGDAEARIRDGPVVRYPDRVRERIPGCKVEVLVPDFQGSRPAMEVVMNAHPDVMNHNTETVPRLYRQVRLGAQYKRSLEMLAYAKQIRPFVPTKSGLMLGLGETKDEVLQVMRDLRAHHGDILTLGQYLRPTPPLVQADASLVS